MSDIEKDACKCFRIVVKKELAVIKYLLEMIVVLLFVQVALWVISNW